MGKWLRGGLSLLMFSRETLAIAIFLPLFPPLPKIRIIFLPFFSKISYKISLKINMEFIKSLSMLGDNPKKLSLMISFPCFKKVKDLYFVNQLIINFGLYYWKRLGPKLMALTLIYQLVILTKY